MKRLLLAGVLVAIGCGKSSPPAPLSQAPPPVPGNPKVSLDVTAIRLLNEAENERSAALYEKAVNALTAWIDSDPKDAVAYAGRALMRWRLSLMRGNSDPEIAKDLASGRDDPLGPTVEALSQLVDNSKARGGWEPLAPRILKEAFIRAFPESSAFATDWSALLRPPEGETQKICETLAGKRFPDHLSGGVKAALEGRDIPPPEREGILWILTALRLPSSEAMKMLESASSPDQGILMQAQAQLLAAEGKFTEATGRMQIAPLPVLRAAANVAAGKPAPALETLEGIDSAFARALKAAALVQTGTPASLEEAGKLAEFSALPYLKFERGIRWLAAGQPGAGKELQDVQNSAGAYSQAWYGLSLWHLQDSTLDSEALSKIDFSKLDPGLLLAVQEALGFSCYAKGEDEKGANWLLEAIKKAPSRELFFKYAKFFRGDRQWKALEELAKAVTREMPAEPEVWAAKAEAAFWLKNYEGAVQTVTFAAEQKLDAKKFLKWRALAYEELGKAAEAHEDWSQLTGDGSDVGEAFAHRAWMRAKLGRWAEVKDDAEQGISRGANPWALALARFALAAEALNGAPPEGEQADPEARKAAAVRHLDLAVKTGAVEPSDLEKIQETLKPLAGTDEWKKIVESSAEKQKELKDDAKRGGILGVMLDHSGGSVAVVGTYRKSGARTAGLAPGDIILEVDGRRVNHIQDVSSIISGREPGQVVKVKIERELRPKLKLVQIRSITLGSRDVFEE
jgi:hypothetical protein